MLAKGNGEGGDDLTADGNGGIGSPSDGATTLGLRKCGVPVEESPLLEGPGSPFPLPPVLRTIS